MLEYKVNKFPPWLFSTKSNTPLRRKTHEPNSHRWSPLSWFCLLRRRPWFYFHITYQLTQLRHGFSYDYSMLKYKVIKFPHWLFSTMSNTPLRRKTKAPNSHRWSPLSWFCLLRRRPWPSNRQQERQWSDSGATAVQFRIFCTLSGSDMKYSPVE